MSAPVARRYFLRARDALKRGDLEAAQQGFGAAVELQPGFAEARVGYAMLLCRNDPPRAAQSLRIGLRTALRPTPRSALLCALGDVLIAGGDFPGAETAFGEAATLPGANRRLHDRLARLRAKTGQYAESIAELLAAARARS